jgi:NADH:ubiquinone oxidoreductase subunit F (NADH-binding)
MSVLLGHPAPGTCTVRFESTGRLLRVRCDVLGHRLVVSDEEGQVLHVFGGRGRQTGQLDTPLDYEALAAIGGMLGHGGVVVFDDTVDMAKQARFAFEFCAKESCGKCTPCRIGAVRGVETVDRVIAGVEREKNLALVDDLNELMTDGSLCAMGGLTPMPVKSALRHFPEDFRRAPQNVAAE